jgi:basic membrane protein A and related proteins
VKLRPGDVVLGGLAVAALLLGLAPARGEHAVALAPKAKATARVGLVFDVGGRGDKSFNDAAFEGLERARAQLGVEARYLEPQGSADRESALRLFAASGLDLVIGVGFIFSSDIDEVARAYPNVRFACIDYAPRGDSMPPNVAGLSFREEEGSFLVGAAAGLLSKSQHVGFVGGMTGPLIRKFEVGYVEGVRATCPACEVHSAYAGTTPDAYRDPAKGKALAVSQIALGADVVYHASGATGHGVFEAAREAKALAIGVDADQHDEMPGTVVTSMVKRADSAVYQVIERVLQARFQGGMQVFGLKESGVDWVHEGPHAAKLPTGVVQRVEQLRGEIASGQRSVPTR